MIDKYCNKDIGIYHVEYLCDFKSNDGHKMYHVKCNVCGFETDIQYRHISDPKECKHIGLNGYYIDNSIKWQNKRISKIFFKMKQRCYNENDKNYNIYGGKGIKIYCEWLKNPILFEQWALENGYADNLTIDRKDSDKDYCPENCRWVTLVDNAKYKSTTRLITVDNMTMTGRDWSKYLNLGINRINTYIRTYGEEKTKELIHAILTEGPKKIESTQTWFEVYNITGVENKYRTRENACARPIKAINETGEIIEFQSIAEAAKYLNIDNQLKKRSIQCSLQKALHGSLKTYKGYKWEYI